MKGILSLLLLGIFVISFANAFEFDNIMDYNSDTETIIIENAFGLGQNLIELTLQDNGCDNDGRYCSALLPILLYEEGQLVEGKRFYTIDGDEQYLQNVRWSKLEYWGEIIDYETVCDESDCTKIESGKHYGWVEFNEEDNFNTGYYLTKLSGEKKPSRKVDWQIKVKGEWTTPWAIWGNISAGDNAEVILNSPLNDSTSLYNNVSFNATANVTNGAILTNMTLWTNQSSSWALSDSINITFFSPTSQTAVSPTGGNTLTAKQGLKFVPSEDIAIVNVTKYISTTATKAYITDENATTIAEASFSGSTATFSSPVEVRSGESYYLLADKSGASYSSWLEVTSFPIEETYINWTAGTGNGGASDTSTVGYNFISITVEGNNYPINDSRTQIWNRTITDNIIWNVESCDSDGDCGFAVSNYSLSIDTVPPTITMVSPTTDYTIDYIGQNSTYLTNTSDTNLESCWYSEDSLATNTTYTCNTPITNRTLGISSNNLYVCANDSVGNENCVNQSFGVTLLSNISLEFNSGAITPTCTIEHGTVDSNLNWITETINRANELECSLTTYGDANWTIYPNASSYSLNMYPAYLNLTFDALTNVTITPYSGSTFTNVTNVYVNQSDIDAGTVTVTYNRLEDGGVQTYSYYNDYKTNIDENLHILSGTFQQVEVQAKTGGQSFEGVRVSVDKQINGQWEEIYSGYTDTYGKLIVYVLPDDVYKFTGEKDNYETTQITQTILTAQTNPVILSMDSLLIDQDDIRFYSNCGTKVKEKTCYLTAESAAEKSKFEISYFYNDTSTSKICYNAVTCTVSGLKIQNETPLITANLYVEEELTGSEIRIVFNDVSLRDIQITWIDFDITNDTYVTLFYMITLIAGLFITVSIESKKKGWGIYGLTIWFTLLATSGFGLYWFVVIPIVVLKVGKIVRNQL